MRLVSFDAVTAVAVVGAIDALRGHDSVVPPLDFSQALPRDSAAGLIDLDFAELMTVAIDPAARPAEIADIDLAELDLEQLLATQTNGGNEPLAGLASAAIEDLLQVELDATNPGESMSSFDLTAIDLDILQDLQFGEDAPLPTSPYFRFAALDLTAIPQRGIGDAVTLLDRDTAPTIIATSDYAAVQSARIESPAGAAPAVDPDAGSVVGSPGGPVVNPPMQPIPSLPGGPIASPPGGPIASPPGGPLNLPPTPSNDVLETQQGIALTGNVLINDSDPNGDPLSIAGTGLIDTAKLGVVEIAADGTFTYAPPGDFHGVDSFMYSVIDTQGAGASATVSIDVIKANSAPIAADDLFTGLAGTALSGNVLANDHDPDGDAITVTSTGTLATEQGGTVLMQADGTFDYKPLNAETGIDGVTYSVADGHGGSADATVTFELDHPASVQYGTDASDQLVGNQGDDTLVGNGGNDVLIGLAGADILQGGDGADTASYENSTAGVEVSLAIGSGLSGHADGDVLSGIENLIGSNSDDHLHGDSGGNAIDGGAGNDALLGDAGNDLLMGGDGNDILDGGLGIDALLGGSGDDIFVVGPGTGTDLDVIADFESGNDVIDLSGFGLSGISELSIAADGIGGSMITLPGGDSLSVLLVDPASLSPNDFIF